MLFAASDLRYIMADCEVPEALQADFYHAGFTTQRLFGTIVGSAAEMRDLLRSEFGTDATASLNARATVSKVLAAWESVKEQVKGDNDMRVDARANRLSRVCGTEDHTAMKNAYQTLYGKLPSAEVPSRAYVGVKLDQVEKNEPLVESLADITSLDDGEEDFLGATITDNGQIRLQKGSKKGTMPKDPEELRAKHKLWGNAWCFIKLKHTNRLWLAGITPESFRKWSDWILGEDIFGVRTGKGEGPSWDLLMEFEKKARKKVYELVQDGLPLAQAMKDMEKDQNVRSLHLISPLSLGHKALPPPTASGSEWNDYNHGPKEKKRKTRKERGDDWKPKWKPTPAPTPAPAAGAKWLSKTEDGRSICFAYSNPDENCDGSCGMVHVCRICLGNHPTLSCKGKGKGGKGKAGKDKGGKGKGGKGKGK